MAKAPDGKPSQDPLKDRIAKRVAQELPHGGVVNLGVGIPSLATRYLPENKIIYIQSENGILGVGPFAKPGEEDPGLIDASRNKITLIPGASICNSAESFAMIRGNHMDATVIGALEVSEQGDVANWSVPAQGVYGVGGAMDLMVGVKKVIVAMQHTSKDGAPKILEKCTLPLTAAAIVNTLITEFAVFNFIDKKMLLVEHTSDITIDKLRQITPAHFDTATNLKIIPV